MVVFFNEQLLGSGVHITVMRRCVLAGCLLGFLLVSHTFGSFIPSTESPGDVPSLWGTYRPNTYFGVRARLPESPLFGMMWASTAEPLSLLHQIDFIFMKHRN